MDPNRLHCALCGRPLSAVEYVGVSNSRLKRHVGWHPACYENDPTVERPLSEALPIIEARGPGRVGELADD